MLDELEIVGRLYSGHPDERRAAREHLDKMGSNKAFKLLLSALGNENWRFRKAAADLLIAWEDPAEVVKSLIHLLGETSDAARRNAAVEILIKIGSTSIDLLHASLRDTDPHVQKLVVDVLGTIADRKSESPLIGLLTDNDDNVRMAAAEALSNYNTTSAANALLRILRGPDVPMRFYAMESLSKMNVALSIEDLRSSINQRVLRRAALSALGNCPSEESVKFLVEAFMDPARGNRFIAISSIGKLHKKYPDLKDKIERELSAQNNPKDIVKVLLGALDSPNTDIQNAAVRLLGLIGQPESAPHLIESARNENLQAESVEALKLIVRRSRDSLARFMPPQGDPLRELLDGILNAEASKMNAEPFSAPRFTSQIFSIQMTNSQFKELRDYLHNSYGIFFSDDLKFILEKRLARRLETLNLSEFDKYLDILKSNDNGDRELGEVINILTTNETYFFREKFQLNAFKDEILPAIHKSKSHSKDRKIKVWSAGCSSGEEAYTIAILVHESGLFEQKDIRIVGSDISGRVLQKARNGIYSSGSFREMPAEYLQNYFRKLDNGEYAVDDRIRPLVEFKQINLVNRDEVISAGSFDVVFCRNVIIYFDIEVKRKVIDYLFSALDRGGYLLLGHSESLLNISTRFDLTHLKNDMVYRKPISAEVGQL